MATAKMDWHHPLGYLLFLGNYSKYSRYFDVVIFDEASQVLPDDAVPALLRAERAVVAGDKHQLPPTTFFAVASDEDDEAEVLSAAEGFESLIDLMSSFLEPWSISWHYYPMACLQTNDEICAEMVRELGFKHCGVRSEEAVRVLG